MAGLIYPDNLCLISEVREVELLCRKERNFSGQNRMLLFRKKGCLLKLYMPRNFSVGMGYLISAQCCAIYTNLKMNCPDRHIFITKQTSKCCHCLTYNGQLKYINGSKLTHFIWFMRLTYFTINFIFS
jgi:hypothetical protein